MRHFIAFLFISICSFSQIALAQTILRGVILDDKKKPISFANVFIEGTIDGASSNEAGIYELETDAEGEITLKVSFIGYQTFSSTKDISQLNDLTIILKENPTNLKEVVVTAGSYQLKGGNMENANAVGLVTTAGSEGDLYKSIALLPGSQVGGSDGKLQVRGGSSSESQTFVDDMHVMTPYTAMPENVSVRGKYSPFFFDVINFSMGGYSPEYSQSLSSVLPLETKNESPITKIGANLLDVGLGAGGTKAWDKGSTSFEASYMNLEPYTKIVHPSQKDVWGKYYQSFTASNQTRFTLGEKTYLKTFFSYDKTGFIHKEAPPFQAERNMDLNEDNLYLNTTFRKRNNGFNYFAGAAFSWNKQKIGDALVLNDMFKSDETELHLKTKADKRFSNLYKLGIGAESYIKSFDMNYRDLVGIDRKIDHSITGLFLTNDFNLSDNLFLNVSSRIEYTSQSKDWAVLPRIAIDYRIKEFTISATAGKYQQTAAKQYLVYNEHLTQENTMQYVLSMQNAITNYRVFRAELYYKKYDKLVTMYNNAFQSDGDGYSKGIDLLYKDGFSFSKGKSLEYMLTYSYNDSKRKYLEFQERVRPDFARKHNSSIILKYTNLSLKSIWGITNRFASGRPYHDPNKPGMMNSKTSKYNSLDVSWTFLAHKRLIIHASASNILNRDNVFGYHYDPALNPGGKYEAKPIKSYMQQFFIIGFFFSLSGNVAYEPSNF